MLKLYIDDSPLKTGHAVRGIGAYTRGLKEAMKKREGVSLAERADGADVILYPYFDLFFNTLRIKKGEKVVVMIHDVIPLLYPKNYPPGIKGKLNFLKQKKELKKAALIVCDSETSKKDIVRFLDIPQEKVFPTHLAPNSNVKPISDKKTLETVKGKYDLPEKFVLYVGDINYNKNVLTLVKACTDINVCLVIAGKQAASEEFDREHIENKDLKELIEVYGSNPLVKRVGFVPDEDLSAIFSLATLYCQPSFYEGFGLPVLEAMKAGCPVICSKTQALVEIAEDGALYFDPKDCEGLKEILEETLDDTKKLQEFRERGFNQVKKFSWEKTAAATLEAIQREL